MMDLKKTIKGHMIMEKDLAVFSGQFSVMLASGISVLEVLEILAKNVKKHAFKEALEKSYHTVKQGHSLSEAFNQHPEVFPILMRKMIYAGEMAGSLSTMFESLEHHYEKQAELKHKLLEASLYPVIILIISLFLVFFLLQSVVPIFVDIFDQLGTEIPAVTKGLLMVSEGIAQNWEMLFSLIILLVIVIKLSNRQTGFRYKKDRLFLKLPFWGNLYLETEIVKMASTMAMLLNNRIGLVPSITIVQSIIKNAGIRTSLLSVSKGVENGKSLSESMLKTEIYPSGFIAMVRVGEFSGNLGFSLSKAATFYEKESERKMQLLMRIFEPAILLFIGIIVFVIVVSVMLPVYEIYSGYSNLL